MICYVADLWHSISIFGLQPARSSALFTSKYLASYSYSRDQWTVDPPMWTSVETLTRQHQGGGGEMRNYTTGNGAFRMVHGHTEMERLLRWPSLVHLRANVCANSIVNRCCVVYIAVHHGSDDTVCKGNVSPHLVPPPIFSRAVHLVRTHLDLYTSWGQTLWFLLF